MAESSFRGDLGGLTADEMNEFLQSAPLARLATLKPDGSPYVMPVWYQWDGEALYFVGRQRAKWCEHIKADGRVSVVIDAEHSDPDESGQSVEIPKVYMVASPPSRRSPTSGAAGCRSPSRCRTGISAPTVRPTWCPRCSSPAG